MVYRTANLVEQFQAETGTDSAKARRLAARQISKLLASGKAKAMDFSLREMFDTFVNPDQQLDALDLDNTERIAQAVGASEFPYITSKLISSEMLPAYEYGLNGAEQLVHETTSTHKSDDVAGIEPAPNLTRVEEHEAYQEVHIGEKTVNIKNYKFGEVISLTKEAILFDDRGTIVRRASQLGEKIGLHRHRWIVEVVTDQAVNASGLATQQTFKIDGTARAMYAATHATWYGKLTGGGYAAANLTTSAGALAFAGVDALRVLLAKMVDERGDYMFVNPHILMVPATLETTADQVIGTDRVSNSADWAINTFRNKYRVFSSPYLDQVNPTPKDYYLGDPAKQTRWQWVWKPRVEVQTNNSESAFASDIVRRFKISYMGGCAPLHFGYVAMADVA